MQPARNSSGRSRRLDPEFTMPLPRFHPAIYQSPTNSNSASTLISPRNTRAAPALKPSSSTRQNQSRQHNDATRKLIEYQQEIFRSSGTTGSGITTANLPGTPSLVPCGSPSPGPATPLTLEDQPGDYLTAGVTRRSAHSDAGSQREIVERMIRQEQERQGHQAGPSSPPVSPSAAP